MEPTALTIVSQLIVDAQTRHGAAAVRRLDVAPDLLDDSMDAVLALGGRVGLDWCEVDRVEIHGLPDGHDRVRVWLHGEDEPQTLTPLEDGQAPGAGAPDEQGLEVSDTSTAGGDGAGTAPPQDQ